MGDYRARDWKPVKRSKDFKQIVNEKKAVIVKPDLKFDESGRRVR